MLQESVHCLRLAWALSIPAFLAQSNCPLHACSQSSLAASSLVGAPAALAVAPGFAAGGASFFLHPVNAIPRATTQAIFAATPMILPFLGRSSSVVRSSIVG